MDKPEFGDPSTWNQTVSQYLEPSSEQQESSLLQYVQPNVSVQTSSSNQDGVKVNQTTINSVMNLNIPLTSKLKLLGEVGIDLSRTGIDLSKYGEGKQVEKFKDAGIRNIGLEYQDEGSTYGINYVPKQGLGLSYDKQNPETGTSYGARFQPGNAELYFSKQFQDGGIVEREGFAKAGLAKASKLKKLYNKDPKEFIKQFIPYLNEDYKGNLKQASESVDIARETIRSLYERQMGKPLITGAKKLPDISSEGISFKEFTTQLKKDPSFVVDKTSNPNYLNARELAKELGINLTGEGAAEKKQRDYLTNTLKKLNVKFKSNPQIPGSKLYQVSDVVTKLIEKSKFKKVAGEAVADSQRLTLEKKLDPDLYKFKQNLKKTISNATEEAGFNLDTANVQKIEDVGHAVSIKEADKYPKLFKNSNAISLQSLIYQDPILNREILSKQGIDSSYGNIFKKLDSFVGKKVTPENQKSIQILNEQMSRLREKAINLIEEKAKTDSYFAGQEKRIPLIKVEVPEVGSTFKSENLKADMSVVDDYYRFGQPHQINPNAKKFKDLTEIEKLQYVENTAKQNADNVTKFYANITDKKTGQPIVSKNEINDLRFTLETEVNDNLKNYIKPKTSKLLSTIPGLQSTGEFISSAAEDLMKRRYLSGALKTAGVAGLGYGIYDTGVGFMEGKSVPELATRFVGLDPLYQSAIQYAALSPEAKDIQKKINYEESYKASLEEPLDEGLMSLAPMQKATVREVEKLKQEKQEIEQKQAAIDAARAQERENILSALKAKITGQPVSMEFATGGRVGLEKGGDPKDKPILPMNPMMDEGVQDPSKRGFLKGAGALGLGGFLLGPGILKLAKTFKTKEALNLIQHTAPGQPEWFAPLVEKILTKGTMKKINDKVLDDLYTYHTYEEGGKTITLKKSKPSATDPNATKIDITVEGGGAYDEPFYIEYQYPLPKQYNITPDGDMIPVKTKESNSIFRVSESRPQWQRSGPDDYSLESTVEDFQAISPKEDIFSLPKGKTGILSDVEGLEKIATGKIKNPKLQEARQKVKDKVLETPNEDRVIRYNDYLDLDYYE